MRNGPPATLRRLQRKGLLERIPSTNRYRITALGRLLFLFCTKFYSRAICSGLAQLHPTTTPSPLASAWRRVDLQADSLLSKLNLVA